MSTPPQQPWARSAPSLPPSPLRERTPRRPFLATPLGLFLLILAFAVLLGIAALIYVLVRNNQTPTVNIPTPTMPNPNAFNAYVQAGKRIVRKDEIDANFPNSKTKEKKTFTTAQKAELVAANREPLTTFRSGFATPYRQPPILTLYEKFPYLAQFRNATRLMVLESQVKAANGDTGGAVNAALDGVQFGRKISSGAPLIGGLVSVACQYIGRRPVWDIRDKLRAAEAKAAARRLESFEKIGVGYTDIVTQEKYAVQRGMLEYFRDPETVIRKMGEFEDKADETEKSPANDATMANTLFLLYSKRRIMDEVTACFDAAIAQAKHRYADDHKPLPEPKNIIGQLFFPVTQGGRFRFVVNDAQEALLMVDLALRAYKGEQGMYPDSLNALVPAYLSRLPDDPFAQSGPLRYRLAPKGYNLYSVGPDGKDDKGQPLENPDGKTDREKRQTKEKSLGDIVAGVNQ